MIFSEKRFNQLGAVAALGCKGAFFVVPDKAREACNICGNDCRQSALCPSIMTEV